MRKARVLGLALGGLLAVLGKPEAAVLESPAEGATLSGLGFISGWKCDAAAITVTLDGGEHLAVAMHQERGDLRAVCGGTSRHGFIMQMNWNLVGDGEHEVVAYEAGVEFARATFTVGTTGEEFLKDVTSRTVVDGFPAPGEQTLLEWNESTQHFEIVTVWGEAIASAYDRAYWRQFNADLVAETYTTREYLYAEEPNVDACQAGRLRQAAQNRALEAANQIRSLYGLSTLLWSSLYDQQVQEAALIGAAGGGIPSHFPPLSAKCYTQAGADGSGTSNLFGGAGNRDPADHMVGWANDYNNASLIAAAGHRRWLLNPFAAHGSYGQVEGYAALKVLGFDGEPAVSPPILVEYLAFPYEIHPFNLLQGDPPWSFSVIEDTRSVWHTQHPYFENATITVTRIADGEMLATSNVYTDTQPIGVANFLSWQVEGWEYDTLYEVEISRVALQDGARRDYRYPVFIEYQALVED